MSDVSTATNPVSVLVVDDDPDQQWMVENFLGEKGYTVHSVGDGAAMRQALAKDSYDMVIMDVGLPGEDGFSLTRYLRDNHDAGIIMVTAANDLIDRVLGLELGADDYLCKPIEPRELYARIKSVMRRHNKSDTLTTAENTDEQCYFFKEYSLDKKRFLLSRAGEPCFVEPKCIDLLIFLIENNDRVVTKDEVLSAIWPGRVIAESTISTLIKQLRKSIGDNGKKQDLIRTVHGRGFQFVGKLQKE